MFGIKVFRYLLKFFAIVLIVAFVVLNQQTIELYISPLTEPLTLPLWLMGLVIFAFGFIIGALLLWLNNWPVKRELSRTRKKLDQCEKDQIQLSEAVKDTEVQKLEKPDLP